VNPGGEPERDETGLPPVDIEIPDDARELDHDVQAYYRERRAQRRRQRRTRWHRSLGREGVVLPLLACCLILALITGTLLTVFTATSGQNLTGGLGAASSARAGTPPRPAAGAGSPPAPAIMVSGQPPRAMLAVAGRPLIQVNRLQQAMLVLVPPHCGCGPTLGWLADVARTAHAPAYVVYTTATKTDVQHLYGQLSAQRKAVLTLAQETDGGILTRPSNIPAGIQAGTLTAILVGPGGLATYASRLDPRDNPAPLVQAITA